MSGPSEIVDLIHLATSVIYKDFLTIINSGIVDNGLRLQKKLVPFTFTTLELFQESELKPRFSDNRMFLWLFTS